MRMRRILGLALAAATLVGVSAVGAVGAVSAEAASSPNISREECTAAGGQIVSRPYSSDACVLPDGTRPAIT